MSKALYIYTFALGMLKNRRKNNANDLCGVAYKKKKQRVKKRLEQFPNRS